MLAVSAQEIGNIGMERGQHSEGAFIHVFVKDTTQFRLLWESSGWSKDMLTRIGQRTFRIRNEQDVTEWLSRSPWVTAIESGDRRPEEETVLGDFDLSANGVNALHAEFPEIAGENLVISVKEKPVDLEDPDVRGRIVLNEHFDEPPSLHATIMATIAAGGGNTAPEAKGVAWKALITSSDFDNLLPDDGADLIANGVSVQNHSYGVGVENYYGIEAAEYDLIMVDNPRIVHVFSSGNRGEEKGAEGLYSEVSGYANITGQFKTSKNSLTVGSADRNLNIAPRSSKGPAHDGRIKPELTAVADAGSSESAAVVSGAALVIQDAYKRDFGNLPDAALVKAILINSADDIGREHPDFASGFGMLNVLAAVRTVVEGRFYSHTLNDGEEHFFEIDIPDGIHELKVTLCWNDPAAEPYAARALVNDLDLSLENDGGEFLPWVLDHSADLASLESVATRGKDHLNNVEQVTLINPASGTTRIKVRAHALLQEEQPFFVAFELRKGFVWMSPVSSDAVEAEKPYYIRWQWAGADATGVLEYQHEGSAEWISIADVDLGKGFFIWNVPEPGTLTFRMKIAGQGFVSEPVSISKRINVSVGYNCQEKVMYFWNSIEGVSGYNVYGLGERYLELMTTTSDTVLFVQKSDLPSEYITIEPLFGAVPGRRASTIDYTVQGVGCYIISFVPVERVVTSVARFEVKLGTVSGLTAAVLEKKGDAGFSIVTTMSPVTDRNFVFEDDDLGSTLVTYRVRLVTDEGEVILSDEERITFVKRRDMFVYPNPVIAGSSVSILTSDEEFVSIDVVDVGGRLIMTAADFGFEKFITTDSLIPGIYLIRLHRPDGSWIARRLLVL